MPAYIAEPEVRDRICRTVCANFGLGALGAARGTGQPCQMEMGSSAVLEITVPMPETPAAAAPKKVEITGAEEKKTVRAA